MSGNKRARNPRAGKRKKKKDPNAPKRPRSAYILYCTEMRDDVKKQHEGAKPAELMQIMGQMWNQLPAHKKTEFNDKAKEDKTRYNDEMKSYTPPEDDDDDDDDGGRRKRGRKRDPAEPKRAPSAYLLYGQRVREEVKKEHPEAKSSEIMKLIGQKWQKLTDEEKKPFIEEASQLKSKYDEAKASYKSKGRAAAEDDDGGKDDDDDAGNDDGGDDDEDDGGDDDGGDDEDDD